MYRNLNEYIAYLEKNGELIRITEFVDPVLEVAEITDRESKKEDGGKALLFENNGSQFPILTNMLGSTRRINMALGSHELDELTHRIDSILGEALAPRKTLYDKLKALPMLSNIAQWMPKSISTKGECQEIILDNLDQIPVLKCWPFDGGRFITLPLVHTQDPSNNSLNIGMYRMQIFDPLTTGMHWHRHKTGAAHYQEYKKLNKLMPVTVCLGGDPAYTYAATAPLPPGINEYILAGFLRNKPVKMVKCLTNDLEVPFDCDFVIEGYVDPSEALVVEGDFGDHTGFYSLKDLYPKFHVTCITARRNAVYPATLVGIPPQEDAYIAQATEKIFLSPIRFVIAPEITNLEMPIEGVAHNIAIASIKKSYPGQGSKVGNALWGAGQMMFNKLMIVKSDGLTIHESLKHFEPSRDVIIQRGTLDVLDHTSPHTGFGGKILMDMTIKLDEELINQTKSQECHYGSIEIDPKIAIRSIGTISEINSINLHNEIIENCYIEQWSTLLITATDGAEFRRLANELTDLLQEMGLNKIKMVVVFDKQIDFSRESISTLVWLAAANADAARDTSILNNSLMIDARTKYDIERGFPNIVTMSEKIIERIDNKWEKLGIGEFVKSPSLTYIPLIKSQSAKINIK